MKKLWIFLFAILLPIFLSGCNAVYTTVPLGETPAALVADELNGTWIHGEGAVTVHVLDEEAGLLAVGWIEERKKGLKFEEFTLELRELDEWLIAHVVDEDKPGHYVWFLLKMEGRNVVGWSPNLDRFSELVETGQIEGTIKDGDVILNGLPSEQLKNLISSDDSGAIDWKNPTMLIRLGK